MGLTGDHVAGVSFGHTEDHNLIEAAIAARVVKPSADEHEQFVSFEGNDSNDGLTWESSKLTIASALFELGGLAGIIYIGAGVITTSDTFTLPSGTRIIGRGVSSTTITYTGAGSLFSGQTETRTYDSGLEDMTITGPGIGGSTIGVNMDSMGTCWFENILITGFNKGLSLHSIVGDWVTYNTFHNVRVTGCGTGISLDGYECEYNRFFGCRVDTNTTGISFTDSGQNVWMSGQIESNTTGIYITANTLGKSDGNTFSSATFKGNTTAWNVASSNVRYTVISDSFSINEYGAYVTSDSGTDTQADRNLGKVVAATTLGSVSGKITVYDAAGTVLGYLPVYTAIT